MIDVDRHVSSCNIAQELKIDHKTVLNYFDKAGFKKKLDVWVSQQLSPKNMMSWISICKALAKWNEIDPFLKRMATGEWEMGHIQQYCMKTIIVKVRWSSSNGGQTRTNDQEGSIMYLVGLELIIYYELLPYGQTLNSDLYCQQLDHLKLAIDEKRPELANRRDVAFHQNNARPHTFLVTHQKLRELGWEV